MLLEYFLEVYLELFPRESSHFYQKEERLKCTKGPGFDTSFGQMIFLFSGSKGWMEPGTIVAWSCKSKLKIDHIFILTTISPLTLGYS